MKSKIAKVSGVLILGLSAVVATPSWAEPPRWVVRDADSEVVLFGTIHLLPEDLDWKSEPMLEQLEAAEEVWFEVDLRAVEDPEIQQVYVEQGITWVNPLSEQLDPAVWQRLMEQASALGLTELQLEIMRPWLVSIILSSEALTQAGFNPAAGVDHVLYSLVEDQEVRALETAEQQIRMLAGLPRALQVDLLESTLDDAYKSAEQLRELAEDWAEGDVDVLEELLIRPLETDYPELYEVILTRRNADWVEQIELELAGSGTDFVAVGVGHLVGRKSVVEMLRERGWSVMRADGGGEVE